MEELTITIDTKLVREEIAKMLEPGAAYLPASAVATLIEWADKGTLTREDMEAAGAIFSSQEG